MERLKYVNNVFFVLLLIFTIWSSVVSSTSVPNRKLLKQYGEACIVDSPNSEDTCNIKETLACDQSSAMCSCADPENMIFDTTRNLCVGLAGKPCVYHQSEEEYIHYRKNQCIMYSQCENKTCTCWSGFYPDENGHCLRKKGYMEVCNSSFECDNRKAFSCINGLCSCDNKTGAYIPSKGRCVGLAGEKCLNSYKECVTKFKCRAGVCRCKYKEGEAPDGSMICEPMFHRHGKKCGKFNKSCGDEKDSVLVCIDSKCRCRNPDYQIYDYETRSCLSLVGGPCNLRSEKIKSNRTNSKFDSDAYSMGGRCIQYAHCVPYLTKIIGNLNSTNKKNLHKIEPFKNENSLGRCECMDDFTETAKGRCSLPFGASCDSRSNKYDKCDKTVPLSCVDFKCSCINELDVYERKSRKCKKSVSSLCKKTNECVKNADCIVKSAGLPGRCTCRSRYQTAINGTCV